MSRSDQVELTVACTADYRFGPRRRGRLLFVRIGIVRFMN
jgi:hypothetical protein